MNEYNLKVNEATGKVRYVMVQKGGNVQGETPYESALWMLNDGAKKHGGVRMTDEIEGYPLTADGVYFFERVEPGTAGEAEIAHPGDAEIAPTGNVDVEIGADGLPIPAGDGEKKGRKKRIKDEVCE